MTTGTRRRTQKASPRTAASEPVDTRPREDVVVVLGAAHDSSNQFLLEPIRAAHETAVLEAMLAETDPPSEPVILAVDLNGWLTQSAATAENPERTNRDALFEAGYTHVLGIDDDIDGGMSNPDNVRRHLDAFLQDHRDRRREVLFAYIYQEMLRKPLFPVAQAYPPYNDMANYEPLSKTETRDVIQGEIPQPRYRRFANPKEDREAAIEQIRQHLRASPNGVVLKAWPSGDGFGLFLLEREADIERVVDWYANEMKPFKGIPATDFIVEDYMGVGRNVSLHIEADRGDDGEPIARIKAWSEKITRLVDSPIAGMRTIEEIGHITYPGETANAELQHIADTYVKKVGLSSGVCHVDLWAPFEELVQDPAPTEQTMNRAGKPSPSDARNRYSLTGAPPLDSRFVESGDRPSGGNMVSQIYRLNVQNWLYNLTRRSIAMKDENRHGPALPCVAKMKFGNADQFASGIRELVAPYYEARLRQPRRAGSGTPETLTEDEIDQRVTQFRNDLDRAMEQLRENGSANGLNDLVSQNGLPVKLHINRVRTNEEIENLPEAQQSEAALRTYGVAEFWGPADVTRTAMTSAAYAIDATPNQSNGIAVMYRNDLSLAGPPLPGSL
jgi:hypothetical protein